MKVLILNSGMGKRMGDLTSDQPKCMTLLNEDESILSRQISLIADAGIKEIVMTTGYKGDVLEEYCKSLDIDAHISFVKNEKYKETNYIYSIYCAREDLQDEDIILMHGDLVFDAMIFNEILNAESSCMVVSSTAELPEKDFKAVIENDRICYIGIDRFENAIAAQPLYKIKKAHWNIWLNKITEYCEDGIECCYAENAFNDIYKDCEIIPYDIKNELCMEVDTPYDLDIVKNTIEVMKQRIVYMCFSTDIIHSGHMALIKKAEKLGKVVIGVLTDNVVASYKRYPLVPFEERKCLFQNINGVYKVIEQSELSYRKNIEYLKPDFVVHGDDWKAGVQKPIREEVVSVLQSYGGKLVEYPYAIDEIYQKLEKRTRAELSLPDMRRSRLKKMMEMKGLVTAIEAHSGITGLIAEKTVVYKEGEARQFDAMWVSSLCDSTAKGKPDIELVDMTSRFRTIDDIMEVTTKPIIFDGDTGGIVEHFVYTVKTLERMGVSMVIIEDKVGLKKNSLFGIDVEQTQDTIENFCEKIRAGKRAKKTSDFMICARIESLILEKGMEDAITRAFAYVKAGADGIMIHSRKKEPDEIFRFVELFRKEDKITPIVVVPTSFNSVVEEEFKARGVNIVIYANQLTRSGFPAMQKTAETILLNHRAKEADELCMSIKDIITLIPEED